MCTMFEAVGQNRKKTSLQLYFERLMQEHPKGAYYSYFQKRIQPILDRKRLEKLERSRVPPTNLPQRLPLLPTSQELARTRKRWKLNAKLIPPSWTKKTNVPSIDTPKYRSSAAYRERSPEVHQLIFDSDHPSERLQSRVLRNLAPKFISHRMIEFIDEHWNLILVLISAFLICCLIVVRRKRKKCVSIRSTKSTYSGCSLCRPKVKCMRRVTRRCCTPICR